MIVPDFLQGGVNKILAGMYDIPSINKVASVLDIGANIGAFAIWAKNRWQPKVINCYEPIPDTFEMLKKNTEEIAGVILHENAVYDSPFNSLPLVYDKAGDSLATFPNSGRADFVKNPVEIQAKVFPPKELPEAEVVKIDIEGAELNVVEAMLKHNRFFRSKLIVIEYHREDTLPKLLNLFRDFQNVKIFREYIDVGMVWFYA